jgi:hypothetical protein
MAAITDRASPRWTSLQPPDEITRSLFGRGRDLVRTHPLATDALLAAVLFALSTVWLVGSPFAGPRAVVVQTVLVAAVAGRRAWPSGIFVLVCAVAFGQWLLGFPLIGDVALLIALYTVAAHESRIRTLLAAGLLEAGAVMATLKWEPAGTTLRSLLFLSATVVAAHFAGLAAVRARPSRPGTCCPTRRPRSEPGSRANCMTSSRTACPS